MVNTEIKGYSFITEIITEGKSSGLLTEVKSESSNFVTRGQKLQWQQQEHQKEEIKFNLLFGRAGGIVHVHVSTCTI